MLRTCIYALLSSLFTKIYVYFLGSDDPGSRISIVTNEDGELQLLLLVTSDMKELYRKFPEVIFIDGTYSTNKLRFPLYTILVEDGNGNGRVVGYCFVSDERQETLELMLKEISRVHDFSRVETVILDKDKSEINAVKKVIPNANIELCKFHVMQAMMRKIRKLPMRHSIRTKLLAVSKKLVYARTERRFDSIKAVIQQVSAPLDEYLEKSWIPCKEQWAGYLTRRHVNLFNSTNNRLESHHQKIKQVLSRYSPLHEAVRNLLLLHKTKLLSVEHESFDQKMKKAYKLGNNDRTVAAIMGILTPYSAGLVIHELQKAYTCTDANSNATESCGCTFNISLKLPCRHIFSLRLKNKEQRIFTETDCPDRWKKSFQNLDTKQKKTPKSNNATADLIGCEIKSVVSDTAKTFSPDEPKTKVQKYNKMIYLCKTVADFSSFLGTNEFNEKYDTLSSVFDIWKKGGKPLMIEIPDIDPCEQHNNNTTSTYSDTQLSDNVFLNDEHSKGCSSGTNTDLLGSETINTSDTSTYENNENDCENDETDSTENPNRSKECKSPEQTEPVNVDNSQDLHCWSNSEKIKRATPLDSSESDSEGGMSPVFKRKRLGDNKRQTNCRNVFEDLTNILKLPQTHPIRGRPKINTTFFPKNISKENIPPCSVTGRRKINTNVQYQQRRNERSEDAFESILDGHMLTDAHIREASYMLQKQFPSIDGLHDPVLGQRLQFPVARSKFVQILHNGSLHWITVSNMLTGSPRNQVDVFDSLNTSVNSGVTKQTASILMSDDKSILFRIRPFQKQRGGTDCGLFAIAAATSICNGRDPSSLHYDQHAMRRHLYNCLVKGHIDPFPSRQVDRSEEGNILIPVSLICICKMPRTDEGRLLQCLACHKIFHPECLGIPSPVPKRHWKCVSCNYPRNYPWV